MTLTNTSVGAKLRSAALKIFENESVPIVLKKNDMPTLFKLKEEKVISYCQSTNIFFVRDEKNH